MHDLVGHFLIFTGVVVVFLLLPLLIGRFIRPKLPTPEKDAIYECGEPTIGSSYIQFDLRFYVVALLFIIFDVEVAFFFPWAMVFGGATQLADSQLEDKHRIAVTQKLLGTELNNKTDTKTSGPRDTGIPSGVRSLGMMMKKSADSTIAIVGRIEKDREGITGGSFATAAGFKEDDQIVTIQLENEDPLTVSKKTDRESNEIAAGKVIELLQGLPRGSQTEITVLRDGETHVLVLDKPYGAFQLATFALLDILVFFGVLLVGFAYVWKRGDLDWVRAVTEKAKQAAANPGATLGDSSTG